MEASLQPDREGEGDVPPRGEGRQEVSEDMTAIDSRKREEWVHERRSNRRERAPEGEAILVSLQQSLAAAAIV